MRRVLIRILPEITGGWALIRVVFNDHSVHDLGGGGGEGLLEYGRLNSITKGTMTMAEKLVFNAF